MLWSKMSPSTKIDSRKKDILILGKGPAQGLEHTLSAEKMYSINLSNYPKLLNLNKKNPKIIADSLCVGNISKDWSVDNMKKTGFNGYFYDFSVDYDAITFDDILEIHKYLMEKNNMI